MLSITERIQNCSEGAVITLTADTEEAIVTPKGRSFTLDLGGHTLTAPAGSCPLHVLGSRVQVRNGRIVATGATPTIRVGAADSTEKSYLRLYDDVAVESAEYAAVFISKGATLETSADITVLGGEYAAISGNGSTNQWGNQATIYGGKITAPVLGIYWPQVGDLKIMGGEITGGTGIEIRAGSLYMQSGTVTGLSAPVSVTPNGNGSTSQGAGIAIAQHTTQQTIDVNINGGIVRGFSAVYESNPQNNPADSVEQVSMVINKGTFETVNGGTKAVYSETQTGFVKGGTFTSAVDPALCADGFEVLDNGDGTFSSETVSWEYPDNGIAGGGFIGLRRLVMSRRVYTYKAGGIPIDTDGFDPLAVLCVDVKGGAYGHYDKANSKVILYRGSKEVSGTLENITIILLGY